MTSRRIQRAEREKLVKQNLRAGLGIVIASQQAALFIRHKYGQVCFGGDEPHYLYELGLRCENRGPTTPQHSRAHPPIVRGHRGQK